MCVVVCVHTHVPCMCVCMCMCHTCACVCERERESIYTHVHACIHVCACAYMHAWISVCMHVCACIYDFYRDNNMSCLAMLYVANINSIMTDCKHPCHLNIKMLPHLHQDARRCTNENKGQHEHEFESNVMFNQINDVDYSRKEEENKLILPIEYSLLSVTMIWGTYIHL